MGFSLFGSGASSSQWASMWTELDSSEVLHEHMKRSDSPLILFKHSTRCIISRTVLRNFESEWKSSAKAHTLLLDLLSHREISSEIARLTGVTHQSPQLIVWHNGKVLYHASHQAISAEEVERVIA